MNRAKLVLRRLRKFRSDRTLRWVFPSVSNYTVVTWRRVNPRYAMSGGDFDDINEFQIADITYCRTNIGAIFVQLLMGRDKWTDGFRQQVVIIVDPSERLGILKAPTDVTFDDYPTPPDPDLMPTLDESDSKFDTLELPTEWPKFTGMNDDELDEYISENIESIALFCAWWRPIKPVPWDDWVNVYNRNIREAYRLGSSDA